jgi:thiol:disulfide interchange protein DsbD
MGLLLARAVAAGETPSPFAVYVRPGRAAARPGEELPVAVVLDVAEKHKVYAEKTEFTEPVEIDVAPDSAGRVTRIDSPPPLTEVDPVTRIPMKVYVGRAVFAAIVEMPGADPESPGVLRVKLRVRFQGCSDSLCFPPDTRDLAVSLPVRAEGEEPRIVNREFFAATPVDGQAADGGEPGGWLYYVLFAFAVGLLVSYTPCVYPLVPVTAAVVGASRAGWRKGLALSLLYVLGLSLVYAILGALAARGGGAFGAASTHWAVAVVVGTVFIALAVSMFGVYDLEMPASWQAKLRMRRGGGPLGVFLVGALSGLVASPCVAAPMGAVLAYVTTTGNALLGAMVLFSMAWGMSVLLILAGTFSGFTARLPKAGGWMLAVKAALGVVMVVAALYFLRPVLPARAFTVWLAVPLVAVGIWRVVASRAGPGSPRGKLALHAAGIIALVLGLYFGLGALVRVGMPAPLMAGLYPQEVIPSPSKISFRKDYAAVLAEAGDGKTPVMVDLVRTNCSGCRQLERDVFSRDDVAAEAERFARVKLNIDHTDVPREDLDRLRGGNPLVAPMVVWINGSGRVRHDLTVIGGDVAPEEFLRRMREVD